MGNLLTRTASWSKLPMKTPVSDLRRKQIFWAVVICAAIFQCFDFAARIISFIILTKYSVERNWEYGYTSTMPGVVITLRWQGEILRCPFYFGSIKDAGMSYQDVNSDWVPDFVFGNGSQKIIVAFLPDSNDGPPKFQLIRSDVPEWLNGKVGAVLPAVKPSAKPQ